MQLRTYIRYPGKGRNPPEGEVPGSKNVGSLSTEVV
jgi:hypothetical protein